MGTTDPKARGLRAVEESRADRRRALVFGRVRLQGDSSQFWLWTFVVFGAFGAIYWRYAESELESQKSSVMAKQRAVAQGLGPRLFPFRDQVERWATELAGAWPGDATTAQVSLDVLANSPGVYLRLRMVDAVPGQIGKAALSSLHDGFTSCLFVRGEKVQLSSGKECHSPSQCESGELCNEWNVCSPPTQPYNLRLAYRTLRVLSSAWTDDLHAAPTDLAVRVFERDLEKVTKEDVPVAVDLLTRAKFFTLVLDEEAASGGTPPPAESETAETELQRLQRTEHYARVAVWRLSDGIQVYRGRVFGSARVLPVGRNAIQDEVSRRAQQRQANSCVIAQTVREAIQGAISPEEPAGAQSGQEQTGAELSGKEPSLESQPAASPRVDSDDARP